MATKVDCANATNVESPAMFNITQPCAAFDFGVYTCAVGTLCLLGIIGNIISFTVLWRDDSKSATSFLLRALAVSDSLVLVTSVPLYSLVPVYTYTKYLQNYFVAYPNLLPFLWPSYLIPYTGTIFLTVLVSTNRYFAVCKPFKSAKWCSLDQARKQVVVVAVFAVLYNIPRFFEYERVEVCIGVNSSKVGFEVSNFGSNKVYRILYANILYFLIMHGGPLLTLAFLNIKLIKALKKRQRKRSQMGRGDYQQDITFVLVVVVFVFITCQTPTFIDHILWTFVDSSYRTCGWWHYYYTAIGDMLAILNSSVNFVIYTLTSRKFRQILISMYCNARVQGALNGPTPTKTADGKMLLTQVTEQV